MPNVDRLIATTNARLTTDELAAEAIADLIDHYGAEASAMIEAIVQSRIPGYYPHRHRRYFARRLERVFARDGQQRRDAALAMLRQIAGHVRVEQIELA